MGGKSINELEKVIKHKNTGTLWRAGFDSKMGHIEALLGVVSSFLT